MNSLKNWELPGSRSLHCSSEESHIHCLSGPICSCPCHFWQEKLDAEEIVQEHRELSIRQFAQDSDGLTQQLLTPSRK